MSNKLYEESRGCAIALLDWFESQEASDTVAVGAMGLVLYGMAREPVCRARVARMVDALQRDLAQIK